MGARQSVAQPPRRTASTSHDSSANGAGPGGSGPTVHVPRYFSVAQYNPNSGRIRSQSVGNLQNASTARAGSSRRVEATTDSDSSSEELAGIMSLNRLLRMPQNPGFSAAAFRYFDFRCPICSKTIPSDDIECHLVMCLTRPRVVYNDDVLAEDKGECAICFEEMVQGDTIARLPCLCVYHKSCIDGWFKVKNTCPEHPGDD